MNNNNCNKLIVQLKNVTKEFEDGRVKALRGINLNIQEGDYISIMGPSGSGKSTLLNLIGALDLPSSGDIFIDRHNLADIKNLAKFRAKTIGFVFQLHNLIPTLTALENVLIPMYEIKGSKKEKKKRAKELLIKVGLGKRLNFLPTKLSGGERQRIAIARSLANKPSIILADEPTGDVDSKSGAMVMDLLEEINKKEKTTLIVVTHDPVVGRRAQRELKMLDGKFTKQ